MKNKLIQIALGAVGSMIGVLIQHLAQVPPEASLTVVSGAIAPLLASRVFG